MYIVIEKAAAPIKNAKMKSITSIPPMTANFFALLLLCFGG